MRYAKLNRCWEPISAFLGAGDYYSDLPVMWSCTLGTHQESSFVSSVATQMCKLPTVCPKAWGRWRELWDSFQKKEYGDPFPGTHLDSIHGSDLPLVCDFPLQKDGTQSLSFAPHVNGRGLRGIQQLHWSSVKPNSLSVLLCTSCRKKRLKKRSLLFSRSEI